jgi:hypothetical protein
MSRGASYKIGWHLPAHDPARHQHQERAGAIFEQRGTAHELAQTETVYRLDTWVSPSLLQLNLEFAMVGL